MSLTKLEFLPNEILVEIFEYLSTCDIFQGFYFLNKRYNTLLNSLYFRINLINIFKSSFDYYHYFVFCFVPHRIVSLYCEDVFDRLIYQIRLSDFISLKYLTIINLNIDNLEFIFPKLTKLQQLIYLNLQTRLHLINDKQILFQDQSSSIQKCILNLNRQIIFRNNDHYPNLQYLTIDQCTIQNLISFLHSYTPQLEQLTVTLIDSNILNEINHIHHLKSLIINTHSIPFQRLSNSVFPLFPHLHELNIHATGIDYTNGKQWATILSSNFPDLINFHLHITFSQDDSPTPNDRSQLLKTFQTSYFRSHKWSFAFIHRLSITTIELFSIPLVNKNLSINLYDTHIETLVSNQNVFIHIKELSLYLTNKNENSLLSNTVFSNVNHLKLISEFPNHESYPKTLFVDISHLIKFSRLKSLEFIGIYFPSTSLVLLDYTPNLHSLTIPLNNLIKMTKILTDTLICQRLTTLIKHLTITSIDTVQNFLLFERLPIVFTHLDSLSLFLQNPHDLYILMILILPKMAQILKTMKIFIETLCNYNILKQFMLWLIDYMHTRDLDLVDVKLTDYELYFYF